MIVTVLMINTYTAWRYVVNSSQGQIDLRQIVPLNSQIIPQYS